MADKEDKEEEKKSNRLSLKTATNKVGAEALRQFQLTSADEDGAGAATGPEGEGATDPGIGEEVSRAAGDDGVAEEGGVVGENEVAEKDGVPDGEQPSVADDIQAIFEEEAGDTDKEGEEDKPGTTGEPSTVDGVDPGPQKNETENVADEEKPVDSPLDGEEEEKAEAVTDSYDDGVSGVEGGVEKEGKEEEKAEKEAAKKEGDSASGSSVSPIEEKYTEILEYDEEEDHDVGPDPGFYYDIEEVYARADTSEEPHSLPPNFLSLYHSFGYECMKRNNLHVMDEDNILFSAGNYIQILNMKTKKLKYLPSIGGRGIGALAVHPSRMFFAVGERGYEPDILIFEYPSLKLYRVCKLGTETAYAYLSFSPDGNKLASLGCSPDFMLTIWDWMREKIILRSKAHGQDVFRVSFSTEIEGQLTTGGLGHIKFWKMASTFTGLKLQGELGKFGRTPISDIEGYVELPDGKVLSGTEWGNMLLWDGDLIQCELTQFEKENCHKGMIQEIFLDEGELITAGDDGSIKIWDFETIDGADVLEEDAQFKMEPMIDIPVGEDVKIMSMCKTYNPNNNDTNSIWLAQDGAGGIWKLDISVSLTKKAPELIQSYHSGAIKKLQPCPYTHMVASVGADGGIRVFDYLRRKTLVYQKFKPGGSCLIWASRVVDSRMGTLIAGFSDGVIRVLNLEYGDQESAFDLKLILQHVHKPHTGEVTAMVVDDEGKTLITGSKDDCTLFFFDIKSSFLPVGFIKLESPVTTLAWSKHLQRLLVGLVDGRVLDIAIPDPGLVDTSVTYEISAIPSIREYKFNSMRHKLDKAKYEQRIMKRNAEQEEKLQKILNDFGEEEYLEEKKLLEEANEREEEPVFEGPPIPNKVLNILPYGDKFYLTLDGCDAGYIYECSFYDPLQGLPAPAMVKGEWCRELGEPLSVIDLETDTTVHDITFMSDDSNVMIGMGDGTVRVHSKLDKEGLALGPPFTLPAHSEGIVHSINTSYDTRFLISGGDDGNIFVYKINHAGVELSLPTPTDQLLKPRPKSDMVTPVDDIDDPKAYSIEEAKQKSEYEKMVKTAEEKKMRVRKTITTLRSKFKKLRIKNNELPTHLRLIPKDFEMDPQMETDIDHEVRDMKELLQKQLAWNSEKQRLQLAKLRKRFKDVIATDRIVLHAINSEETVATFRCAKPSQAMQQALDHFKRESSAQNRRAATRKVSVSVRQSSGQGISFARKVQEATDPTGAGGVTGSKGGKRLRDPKANKSLAKAEERKAKRLKRETEWKNLYARKPSENYEDPVLIAAIDYAKSNMGDFNLKTATNYKVPESQRQGGTFKRNQLLELRKTLYLTKMGFNEKLLALREQKMQLISEAMTWQGKLDEIQSKLQPHEVMDRPAVPVLLDDELPERMMEYTPQSLREFKESYDQEQKAGVTEQESGFGFGGFNNQPSETKQPVHGGGGTGSSSKTQPPSQVHEKSETISELLLTEYNSSSLELQLDEVDKVVLLHQQQCLINQMREAYQEFDRELKVLRGSKVDLDVKLKNGDLRVILLFEELLLLKEFEKRENYLKDCLSSKVQDKDDLQEKIEELQSKLDNNKMMMDEMQDNEKLLYESFTEQLGENNKFADFLTKVFKKKIKRVKKSAEAEGDSDESDSDDDYDLSSDDEDEEDDEHHLDLNVCPPGCSAELYDSTILLREKRLDLEEAIQEEKKTIDTLKKELDSLIKKSKIINHGVKGAMNDLEAFQLEKQKKMNELDMIVTLNLNQIQYGNTQQLPQDLSQCLIFEGVGVNKLESRIKELQLEKAHQIKKFKELKKSHIQLIKGKKNLQEKLVELDERCQNAMMLKFGRIVDLDKLESISTNRIAEELKEAILKKDKRFNRKLKEWDIEINQAKQRLLLATREHTGRIDTMLEISKEKEELEEFLDSKQKNLGSEYSGQRRSDLKERQRLLQLVQLQAQEIDALKDEIGILSRKDGHILPPTQTSVPPLPPIGGRK